MENIDSINKEGLFTMVKRITEENSSYVKKLPLKTGEFPKNILLPKFIRKQPEFSPKIKSPNISSQKTITFKHKFLEKNNIQINKQNVLDLISEKRKLKISEIKFFRNNNENSGSNFSNYAKKIMKGKTVYINLEEDENKNLNMKKGNKIIKNSNSEYFDKSFNNKSLGKNLLLLKSPKLDMDSLIKNSKSFFKMFNSENINNNKSNNNNINNNININININGNINNKRYENNTEMNLERINNNKNNSNFYTAKNLSYNIINDKNNTNSNIIKKKHHRKFYLNKINNFENEEEESNLIENIKNKRKINNERNNTVNINVNFISNPKNNDIINRRITTNSNTNRLKLNEENNNNNNPNLRNSINITHIKSPKLKNYNNENYYPLRNQSYRNRNNIIKTSKTLIYDKNSENLEEKNNNNKIDIIQIEDLLILEGKFCHLINCLKYDNPLPKMCAEWWNFYTYSSYFGKFPKLFPKIMKRNILSDYQIAHNSILIELLSIIITYEILTEKYLVKRLINNLMEIINEIHFNFLIECDYILSKISNKSFNNLWIKKLRNVISSKKNFSTNNNHLSLLHQRNNLIQNKIEDLINICSNLISKNDNNNNIDINIDLDTLSYFNNNIQNLPLMELNKYFNFVIGKESLKMSKAFSYSIKRNNLIARKKYTDNLIIVPYLPKIQDKNKYTLVLDLDETLISFRINEYNNTELKLRPGLFNFLRRVKSRYELIVFTAGMKEYAEPILDSIEKKEKFFLKRLYRQHTVYKDNIYIKDLTKLGRDLSKVIIVDNMPQNFCLQKENGILISNYFGQDNGDNTLNLLGDILLKIAQRPGRDVRNEIKKHKEEIFTKITTNLDY